MSGTTDKAELIAQYSQLSLDSKYVRLVAHDVRNQVNTIIMASDMLREMVRNNEGNEPRYVDMIGHASEDILVILEAAVAALNERGNTLDQEDS